jgi:adenine-specific DNA-methyltransferase
MKILKQIGTNNEHNLYRGDNLRVMKDIRTKYLNTVDLIYIDPPYNTGKKMGKYRDNFKSHTVWLDFMRPRIKIGREFLTEKGLMFISIGEQEEAHLKILCNEIFGEMNKVATIIWQSKYTTANDKSGISTQTEYILVYAKDIKKIIIKKDPLREEYIKQSYSKNPDNDSRGVWKQGVQLFKQKNKHTYTVVSPTGKKWKKPWNYSEKQWHEKLVKNNLIYWGKDGNSCPVKKVFLKDTKGICVNNLWLGDTVGYTADGGEVLEEMFGDRNIFLYPKPVSLLKRIIEIAADTDATIMDFFAGSGTVGQAVLELNNQNATKMKFLLITNNENNICDNVTYPRLENIINGYTDKSGETHAPCNGSLKYHGYSDDE